jgi:uncharacterized protein YndB with AHSA1/START domain
MKKKKLIIDRTFNAPIDKVWAAFTNPEILAKWWSPAGMKKLSRVSGCTRGRRVSLLL